MLKASCRYILQTYVRPDIVFTHAEGVRMWDAYGKEYLDFAAGIAVNSVGTLVLLWMACTCQLLLSVAAYCIDHRMFEQDTVIQGGWLLSMNKQLP